MRALQFRHDCQNLGCANLSCNLCKLSQRRRCETNFAHKYLAPCDVIEAKCGAQIYVVVVDTDTGELVSQGLDDAFLQISIIDGRRFEGEGERDDVLDDCQLLVNKQGQPLLAHGRSGTYTDDKRVMVPLIHGQSMLPDLKVTDSSEALLQGRAPPFRLLVRGVQRNAQPISDIRYALSEPFVVATARVKGAAKLEIPHVDDHVSKIECVGVQTQKKLEDIRGASAAAGVPDLRIPINSVTKVGQFRDLVEMAERNKPLRETLKQVLRLTKGWDVARDHVRRAVETDVQLRVYHPDGRTDVGLVFKCGAFNVVEMHRPVGLMRRKTNPQQPNQELVDIIWLPLDPSAHPDAVKKLLPQASSAWWTNGHPGWQFLPLTTAHLPAYPEGGQPATLTSSFTFTIRPAAPRSAPAALAGTGLGGLPLPGGVPQSLAGVGGMCAPGLGGGAPPGAPGYGPGALPLGMLPPSASSGVLPSAMSGLGALGSGRAGLPPGLLQGMPGLLQPDPLQMQQQIQQHMQQLGSGSAGAPLFGSSSGTLQPLLFPTQGSGLGANSAMGLASSSGAQPVMTSAPLPAPSTAPALSAAGGPPPLGMQPAVPHAAPPGMTPTGAAAAAPHGSAPPNMAAPVPQGSGVGSMAMGGLTIMEDDSLSPFEDPTFQQLMSVVAANAPADKQQGSGGGAGEATSAGQQAGSAAVTGDGAVGGGAAARGPAPDSGDSSGQVKRKADTSLETWIAAHKSLDFPDFPSLPPNLAQLSSLFTSLLTGNEMAPGLAQLGTDQNWALQHQGAAGQVHAGRMAMHEQKQARRDGPELLTGLAQAGNLGAMGAAAIAKQEEQGQQQGPVTAARQVQPQQSVPPAGGQAGLESHERPNPQLPAAPAAPPAATPAGAVPAGGAGGSVLLASQQPAQVTGVTMEQMQQMFQRAVRQEISYDQLEVFLKQHNLLPSGQPASAPAQGDVPMAAPTAEAAPAQQGAVGKAKVGGQVEISCGLEDMKSIEVELPAYR